MRPLPLLGLFFLLIQFVVPVQATSIPPPNVQQAGQFVDLVNQEYESQVLIARKVPEGYEISINPNITPLASQLKIFNTRLGALGFEEHGTIFVYSEPLSPFPTLAQSEKMPPAGILPVANSTVISTASGGSSSVASDSRLYLVALLGTVIVGGIYWSAMGRKEKRL